MLKIGITGNIASGKSEFEKILKNLNYKVYDMDILSKEIFKNNKDDIFKIFNTLERKEIADIVFKDEEKRKLLENIIHPKLKLKINEIFNSNLKIVFISGAILYQTGFDKMFDKIIYIDAPYELRLKRLQKRNNLDEKDAILRLNAQNDYGMDKADIIIQNDKTLDELEKKAKETLKILFDC